MGPSDLGALVSTAQTSDAIPTKGFHFNKNGSNKSVLFHQYNLGALSQKLRCYLAICTNHTGELLSGAVGYDEAAVVDAASDWLLDVLTRLRITS